MFTPRHAIFATFERQIKMPTFTIQGGLYLFHYVLDNLNWLLFVFLSNLIINLMYKIKKLYFNDQHKFRVLRQISCYGRNHSQASCEYSLTIFLCCQHHSEYSLLGSKFSTNLLFAASKCHVTIQQHGSSRCSKWPNRMGSLQW